MSAAKAWGLTPSGWRQCSFEDRAEMLAHELIAGTREAYLSEHMQSESERKEKPNAIADMRKQMLKKR